ncbi:NAD(P)-binding protein [Hortaea werneckii]|nr:NAD(P)-binding protein [Hortaea werneckii]KAI7303089.1 NAD(P)-binding protein [Hortaea werneckii]
MPSIKLRVGIAGLGRMGKRHATNFHHLTPRAIVVAASTPDATERQWAESNLEGTTVYQDFEDMLKDEALDAVVVASSTSVHAKQALAAIAKGYHVLCEKPLSIDLQVAREVLQTYNASRRSNPAQRTADLHDTTGNFVRYAGTSGGIFVDCSIHDIDLMLWFMGENRKLKSLQAVGVTAVHPELNAMNDRDNALATVEFDGGRVASLFCSRMMAAGQEDATEIICERGSFRVNVDGRKDFIKLHDSYGARRELPQHYYERFREAFVTEASEFTACCLDGAPMPVSLESSARAIQIAEALQRSLTSGKKIVFDSNGDEKAERMEKL